MSTPDVYGAVPLGTEIGLAVLVVVLVLLVVNRHGAYVAARGAERSFRELYDSISEGVFRSTIDGHMISANPALVALNGFASEQEMLEQVQDIGGEWYVDPGRRNEINARLNTEGRVSRVISEVYRYKTRERIWIEESIRLLRDERTGMPRYYEGTVREVTDMVRRLELQARHEKIESIVSGCLYQCRFTPQGKATMPYASVGIEKIFGVDPAVVAEDAGIILSLIHPADRAAVASSIHESARNLTPWQSEYRVQLADGSEKWILGHAVPEREPDGAVLWHGFLTDVTQRKRAEARIYDLAYSDTLTGLPNRAALAEGLQKSIGADRRSQRWHALLFIDLDQFKVLNDTKGHHVGDRLLCGVASRLRPLVGDQGMVARLGGDEFVILLRDLATARASAEHQVSRVVDQLRAAIAEPFVLDGFPFHTSASVGVAVFRNQETNVEELLKRADMAMYEAKASGGGSVSFFVSEMQAVLEERLALTNDLRDALDAGALRLHYQPQLDDSGAVFAVEALLRWDHPQRGDVAPGTFLPLAERAGLLGQIDDLVLTTACATLRRWQDEAPLTHLQLAVNIGGRQLSRDLVGIVTRALETTGANPERLTIEITEHVMLDCGAGVDAALAALKKLGVKISLDDFGTGYSSLSHLKRLPIDALKIDCSFVRDIETDQNDRVIVQTILNIARNLGISAIAEGVENEMQALLLRRFGCRAFQGFLYGRPMSADDFEHRYGDGARLRQAMLPPSRLVV